MCHVTHSAMNGSLLLFCTTLSFICHTEQSGQLFGRFAAEAVHLQCNFLCHVVLCHIGKIFHFQLGKAGVVKIQAIKEEIQTIPYSEAFFWRIFFGNSALTKQIWKISSSPKKQSGKKDVKAVVEDWCNHRDIKADSSGNRDQPRPHIVTDRTAKS